MIFHSITLNAHSVQNFTAFPATTGSCWPQLLQVKAFSAIPLEPTEAPRGRAAPAAGGRDDKDEEEGEDNEKEEEEEEEDDDDDEEEDGDDNEEEEDKEEDEEEAFEGSEGDGEEFGGAEEEDGFWRGKDGRRNPGVIVIFISSPADDRRWSAEEAAVVPFPLRFADDNEAEAFLEDGDGCERKLLVTPLALLVFSAQPSQWGNPATLVNPLPTDRLHAVHFTQAECHLPAPITI